jgi:hypothetical protein
MLSKNELANIARTTKYNWRDFKHEDYYGYDWAKDYIHQFDAIKDVFESKFTARAIRTILKTRRGYYNMLGEFAHHKNLMKMHADNIVASVEDMAKFSGVTVKKACKFYGISKDWYYTQKQKVVCALSPIKKCYRQYNNQLALHEVSTIEHLVTKPQNKRKPLSTIYYDALNIGSIACGLTTFRKYANALGYEKPKPIKPKRKKGFKTSYVFEWLHVDVTEISTYKEGVQKVAFVKDNFSSALLHVKSISDSAGSSFITGLLQETIEKYKLYDFKKDILILSDGGPENKGEVLSWIKHTCAERRRSIKTPPIVKKITALTNEFPFSNAMSERTHSIYKSEFMGGDISDDTNSHLKSLSDFMDYYNHHRYPCRLYGKTPMQIVYGEDIDKKLFTQQLKEAKLKRLEANRNFNECIARLGCKPS